MPSEMRRLKQLEEENHRLKRLVADEPGQGDAAGGRAKKALRPVRRRDLVDDLGQTPQVNARRA